MNQSYRARRVVIRGGLKGTHPELLEEGGAIMPPPLRYWFSPPLVVICTSYFTCSLPNLCLCLAKYLQNGNVVEVEENGGLLESVVPMDFLPGFSLEGILTLF